MVMDVLLICMGADNKGMVAFQESLGKFVADAVRLLRRNLAGAKGLAHLIGDHIAVLPAAGQLKILAFGKRKFCICGLRVAGIGADQLALLGLIRIFAVIQSVGQALPDGFSLVLMHGDNACCCHIGSPPFSKKKGSCRQKQKPSSM